MKVTIILSGWCGHNVPVLIVQGPLAYSCSVDSFNLACVVLRRSDNAVQWYGGKMRPVIMVGK